MNADIRFMTKTSALFSALVVFTLLVTTSCSHKALSLFFDVPPPVEASEDTKQPTAESSGETQDQTLNPYTAFAEASEPLPIENILNWEQVSGMLPKDYKKKVDWSAALEQDLVRPRPGLDPESRFASTFKYDFIIAAEKPKNEAYFPHSAHTGWLGCKNCHMTLYPYKRNPATMKEMRTGASCGACHGKVAFSLKSCKRCHLQR